MRIEALRGKIVHLGEVRTMSCGMAAATGDSEWKPRHHRFVPKLTEAIREAIVIAPNLDVEKAAARTYKANFELLTMENRAFELVDLGRMNEAREVLFSSEYEAQKQAFMPRAWPAATPGWATWFAWAETRRSEPPGSGSTSSWGSCQS